jgi:hypothetical protein
VSSRTRRVPKSTRQLRDPSAICAGLGLCPSLSRPDKRTLDTVRLLQASGGEPTIIVGSDASCFCTVG